MAEFAYCFDCNELNYAIADKNGVFEKCNVSSNHHNCKNVLIFEAPKKYPPPIRNVLAKLQMGGQISRNEIVLFKLAMAIEYDLPYNSGGMAIYENDRL
jgi:hypothetical protein